MQIGSVSMGSQATGMPTIPRSISKDDLTTTRDHLKQDGQDTGSLDKLIATFDKAAGSDGKMSMTQFKSFASDNGVTLPDPSKGPSGGARRGGPPPSGGMPPAGTSGGRGGPAGAAASQGPSSGASSSSSKDVSTQSDSELEKAANQGDQKAIAELKRREEARVRTQEQSVLDSLDAVRLGAKSGSVE